MAQKVEKELPTYTNKPMYIQETMNLFKDAYYTKIHGS